MGSDYKTMIDRAFALHTEKVQQACARHFQEVKSAQAATGFVGRSSHQAEKLGRAIVQSNLAFTKELLADIDRIISLGGDDVPTNAAEQLSAQFKGALIYLHDLALKQAHDYLGRDGAIDNLVKARIEIAWNIARIELDQELEMLVRKHRSKQKMDQTESGTDIPPRYGAIRGISTQVGPIHFEDFSGKEFERLLLGFAIRSGWKDAEWLGEAGADGGRDIWCESSRTAILCANFKRPLLAKAKSDLKKVADSGVKLNTALVVFGGSVSANLRTKIKAAAKELEVNNCLVWGHAELEENIRSVAPSLLERFCGGMAFPESLEEMRVLAAAVHEVKPIAPSKVVLPSPDFDPEQMTSDAKRLLSEMSDAEDGQVLRIETQDGYSLTVNGREFIQDTRERRIKAKWERVLRELLDDGLIESVGASGEIFAITDAGDEAEDNCGLIPS